MSARTAGSVLVDAAFLDFDGTLANTEPIWADAGRVVMNRYGVRVDHPVFRLVRGLSFSEGLRLYCDTVPPGRYRPAPEEIRGQINELGRKGLETRAAWMPGAHDLLVDLRARGIRVALVTNNRAEFVEAAFRSPLMRFQGHRVTAREVFDLVVTVDQPGSLMGKPSSALYNFAATLMGPRPRHAFMCEDTYFGGRAAVRTLGDHLLLFVPDGSEPPVVGSLGQVAKLPSLAGIDVSAVEERMTARMDLLSVLAPEPHLQRREVPAVTAPSVRVGASPAPARAAHVLPRATAGASRVRT